MGIQDTRREVLRALIKRRNNGVVRQFAADIGKPDGQINDMLANPPRKSFGERIARQIELLAKVNQGYLDDISNLEETESSGIGEKEPASHKATEPDPPQYNPKKMSREAIAIAEFIDLLPNTARAEFRAAVVEAILKNRAKLPSANVKSVTDIINFLRVV